MPPRGPLFEVTAPDVLGCEDRSTTIPADDPVDGVATRDDGVRAFWKAGFAAIGRTPPPSSDLADRLVCLVRPVERGAVDREVDLAARRDGGHERVGHEALRPADARLAGDTRRIRGILPVRRVDTRVRARSTGPRRAARAGRPWGARRAFRPSRTLGARAPGIPRGAVGSGDASHSRGADRAGNARPPPRRLAAPAVPREASRAPRVAGARRERSRGAVGQRRASVVSHADPREAREPRVARPVRESSPRLRRPSPPLSIRHTPRSRAASRAARRCETSRPLIMPVRGCPESSTGPTGSSSPDSRSSGGTLEVSANETDPGGSSFGKELLS